MFLIVKYGVLVKAGAGLNNGILYIDEYICIIRASLDTDIGVLVHSGARNHLGIFNPLGLKQASVRVVIVGTRRSGSTGLGFVFRSTDAAHGEHVVKFLLGRQPCPGAYAGGEQGHQHDGKHAVALLVVRLLHIPYPFNVSSTALLCRRVHPLAGAISRRSRIPRARLPARRDPLLPSKSDATGQQRQNGNDRKQPGRRRANASRSQVRDAKRSDADDAGKRRGLGIVNKRPVGIFVRDALGCRWYGRRCPPHTPDG